MKRLEIWIFGIALCAFGMAVPASAGTMGETLEPSIIAILTVVAACFGMWLRCVAQKQIISASGTSAARLRIAVVTQASPCVASSP